MYRSDPRPDRRARPAATCAEACIALGLAWLIVVACWPALPAVFAMSLVALGTTGIISRQTHVAATCPPLALLHAAVYTGLYALFVGSSLHRFDTGQAVGWGLPVMADIAASTLPMAVALRQLAHQLTSPDAANER